MESRRNKGFVVIDYGHTPKEKAWMWTWAVIRSIWIIVQQLVVIFAYCVWMQILKPVLWYYKDIYLYIDGHFFKSLLLCVASWMYSADYTVSDCGDDVTDDGDEPALVMINHRSTGDVPTIMYALQNKGKALNDMMWIQYITLLYTDFGWAGYVHGDFFIDSGPSVRDQQFQKLTKHIHNEYIPKKRGWVLVFPEGGLYWKSKEKNDRYAKKNGLPVLKHVLLPRVGAIKTLLESLSPLSDNNEKGPKHRFKSLIDITIGYPENTDLNIQTIMFQTRKPADITVNYRRFPITDVPLDENSLTKWLYDRFVEKDQMMDIYHKTGKFPYYDHTTKTVNSEKLLESHPVRLSVIKMIVVNCILFYLAYILWAYLVSPVFCVLAYVLSFIF